MSLLRAKHPVIDGVTHIVLTDLPGESAPISIETLEYLARELKRLAIDARRKQSERKEK